MPESPPSVNTKETALMLRELPEDIVGERVLLRPYRPGDGVTLWEAVEESRSHLLPFLPWGDMHRTPQDSEAFVRKCHARWLLREDLALGVWRREDGRYLGGIGLHRIRWEVPYFEIGYWLRQSAEGSGYMTEAARLVCRLCFETLGANRIEIQCDARNTRSAAIPRRLGFAQEAALRNYRRSANGELCDFLFFAMTPQDYARQAKQERSQ